MIIIYAHNLYKGLNFIGFEPGEGQKKDMNAEFENKKIIAKKPHRCNWCGERIEISESSIYRKGIYEDEFYGDYYHLECDDALYKSDLDDNEFDPMTQKRGITYDN
jgi:hypothetical protein